MRDTLFIGLDAESGDIPVLVIGRIDPRTHFVDILNAFQGDDAMKLYNYLIKKED